MNILLEKYLAVDEAWYAQFIRTLGGNAATSKIEIPKVEYHAANSLSQRELYWLGIDSAKNMDGKLVAVIPVRGFLAPYWNYSGTNTEWLAEQMKIAADNVNVVSIVNKFNTPGGAVNGTSGCAEIVAKAAKVKPVISYTPYFCASAGLWLDAAATERWILSKTTTAKGSLGVMATYISQAEKLKNEGYDVRVLRSAGSENKNLLNPMEPIDEKALAEEQKLINSMRQEFLGFVLQNCPKVSANIGGEMYYGSGIITAGLADKVGNLEDVIKRAFYLGLNA